MMISTKRAASLAAALLAVTGLVACGDNDDNPVDAGRDGGRAPDGGMVTPDGGPIDSGGGSDTGPLPDGSDGGGGGDDGGDGSVSAGNPNLRLAHLISDVDSERGQVHLCLGVGDIRGLLATYSTAASAPVPIPYGGVSSYVNAVDIMFPMYRLNVFSADDPEFVPSGPTCPTGGTPIFTYDIDATGIMDGHSYTIALVGRIDQTTGPYAPKVVVIEDNNTAPAAGSTRVRVVQGITRVATPAGVALNVDLCFDADGPGSAAAGESVASDVPYVGAETDLVVDLPYNERDPMATGVLYVYLHAPGAPVDCADPGTSAPAFGYPVPFPIPTGAGIPENLTATVDADDVVTLFLRGDAALGSIAGMAAGCPDVTTACEAAGGACAADRCLHPQGPSITPWIDNL
jgi:hypothetical protein